VIAWFWFLDFGLLGPFLRSDTETDFPRPVRSVIRLHFAATVFVRSKPVNCVRILPKMFIKKSKSQYTQEHEKSQTEHHQSCIRDVAEVPFLGTYSDRGF